MTLKTPRSIQTEHDELHEKLKKATESGGETQKAAIVVADLLHEHFVDEEAYAMPPLGLLASLAQGEMPQDAGPAIEMSRKLRANLDHTIGEHRAIQNALRTLIMEATAEGKPEHAEFSRALMLHAQTEEEILYPATLLIGEYLELRMGSGQSEPFKREVALTR